MVSKISVSIVFLELVIFQLFLRAKRLNMQLPRPLSRLVRLILDERRDSKFLRLELILSFQRKAKKNSPAELLFNLGPIYLFLWMTDSQSLYK